MLSRCPNSVSSPKDRQPEFPDPRFPIPDLRPACAIIRTSLTRRQALWGLRWERRAQSQKLFGLFASVDQCALHMISMSCLLSAAELLASTKLIPETKKDRALEIAKQFEQYVVKG